MEKDIQMGLRLKPEFHEKCLKVAKEKGQSLAEWIRRAMQHELDREQSRELGGDDAGAIAAALLKALDDPDVAAEVKKRMDKV